MMDADLNLLRVFDVLYEERSVTRAAERLGLTQSAVSHALGRLRQAMDDRLFLRGARGLEPTSRAAQIAPQIREALTQIRTTLSSSDFDPATASRRFNIAAGAYFCSLVMPQTISLAGEAAPAVSIRIWNVGADIVQALDDGRIDLALAGGEKAPARIRIHRLFDEDLVWVAGRDHPLARKTPDLAEVLAAPRVMIANTRDFASSVSASMAERAERSIQKGAAADSIKRRKAPIRAIAYDSATAIAIVEQTNAVALAPRRFAELNVNLGRIVILAAQPAPADVELNMMWHERSDDDKGLAWLRELIVRVARE